MNKYMKKIAGLAEIGGSTVRLAGKAIKSSGKAISDTALGAAGKGKMDFINHHLYGGKGSASAVSATYDKFNGLHSKEDIDKFHLHMKQNPANKIFIFDGVEFSE